MESLKWLLVVLGTFGTLLGIWWLVGGMVGLTISLTILWVVVMVAMLGRS
jgi:hypothetical protein